MAQDDKKKRQYFVVTSFWEGKRPNSVHYLAGMVYDGPHAEEHLAAGLIEDAIAKAEVAAKESEAKAAELKRQADEQRKNAAALRAAALKRAAGPEGSDQAKK